MITNVQKIAIVDGLGKRLWSVVPRRVLKKALGLASIADMCKRLDTSAGVLERHQTAGRIPAPSVRIGKRWFYTADEVAAVMRLWDRRGLYVIPRSKYSREQVEDMRVMLENGATQWEVADKYGMVQSNVSRLVRGLRGSRKQENVDEYRYGHETGGL